VDVNNHPLNKAAWKWLKEARQPTPQHALYLLDLAHWGLEHGAEGDWPARDRWALEEQLGHLCAWKPVNVLKRLLSNPDGPDPEEQDSKLLAELRGASSPISAATSVLNQIYAVQRAENQALQPAASELR
jgi:hypothetical protein